MDGRMDVSFGGAVTPTAAFQAGSKVGRSPQGKVFTASNLSPFETALGILRTITAPNISRAALT